MMLPFVGDERRGVDENCELIAKDGWVCWREVTMCETTETVSLPCKASDS